MEIVALTPERADRFFELFDGEGFADNPDWAGCYCRCYHFDDSEGEWDQEPATRNRAVSCGLIADGTMRGWLAISDGSTVGWLNAGRKDSYCAFRDADMPGEAGDAVGMITCFLVAPAARGKGVARALLDVALAAFRAEGLSWAEAKPAKQADSAARNYHGPLKLFTDNGFEIVGEFSERQHLVRLAL
ncbi:GNAT family N-acetyltransferase [Croceicoccus ponticola]|uniref:GNAT family N-acetyltransferase n=1 Tax=Croceicoccus ponticola TaxID=2217664 RepID=A0A437H1P8_9SPHN|nr:GNAT family N-acetyltransferase [Croceicoccus ponticola]RVQ69476.1 GNAT family N-acetyltransferase [Croceicoccus ponticola]